MNWSAGDPGSSQLSNQVGVDDRRLPMVDVGQRRGGRSRDREGLEGVAALVLALPQSGERKRLSVRKGQKVGLLAASGPLSLEPRWSATKHQREQKATPFASIPSVHVECTQVDSGRLRFSPEKPRQAPILHPPVEALYIETIHEIR